MNLQNAWPAAQETPVVVHDVAQRLPVIPRLIVEHLTDLLVGLAGARDGVGQAGVFCKQEHSI